PLAQARPRIVCRDGWTQPKRVGHRREGRPEERGVGLGERRYALSRRAETHGVADSRRLETASGVFLGGADTRNGGDVISRHRLALVAEQALQLLENL